jgi:tetratricopeptide (TPR) repeat protein
MTFQPAEAHAGLRRRRSEEAIRLAMQGRWQEAVEANRAILDLFPNDVDAWNRLGKALSELGQNREAVEAYERALSLEPGNQIARRNLERLKAAAGAAAPAAPQAAPRVSPQIFLEETGKTGTTTIAGVSPELAARLRPGDAVRLVDRETALAVETADGEPVGIVEPRIGLRLLKLMKGGNEYAAAVASVADGTVKVIIKETYQHPSQAGKPSFPITSAGEAVRPYIKEGLLRFEAEEEEEEEELVEEVEEVEEWEEPEPAKPARLFEAGPEVDEEEEFEE